MLSQGERGASPRAFVAAGALKGATAESASWWASLFTEIIAGNQVATTFMVLCHYGFGVEGPGWDCGIVVGLKLPRLTEGACLMMVPVLQGIGNCSILACNSFTSCNMPIGWTASKLPIQAALSIGQGTVNIKLG